MSCTAALGLSTKQAPHSMPMPCWPKPWRHRVLCRQRTQCMVRTQARVLAVSKCTALPATGTTRLAPTSNALLCFDGFEWAVSPSSSAQGGNVENPEDTSAGDTFARPLPKRVAGNFAFAAPRSFQSMQLKKCDQRRRSRRRLDQHELSKNTSAPM